MEEWEDMLKMNNGLISVSAVTGYLYCQRKIYLCRVLGLKEEIKDSDVVLGEIRHGVFESINIMEKHLVCSLNDGMDIVQAYTDYYENIVRNVIRKHGDGLAYVGVDAEQAFEKVWHLFLNEAKFRAESVKKFIHANGLFGEELWEALIPKFRSEMDVVSKELGVIGRVDRVAVEDVNEKLKLIPYELKSGNAPKEGIWLKDKMQLAFYILMLNEQSDLEVKEGYVHYLSDGVLRRLVMNPFLHDNAVELVSNVRNLLSSKDIPAVLEEKERKKCEKCGLKGKCFGFL